MLRFLLITALATPAIAQQFPSHPIQPAPVPGTTVAPGGVVVPGQPGSNTAAGVPGNQPMAGGAPGMPMGPSGSAVARPPPPASAPVQATAPPPYVPPPPPPPVVRAPVPPAPPSPPVSGLPADAPKLVINGGTYSQQPELRMVIVNGRVAKEGADLGSGVVLQEIRPSSVVLAYKGAQYNIWY